MVYLPSDLLAATKDFDETNIIGTGGFGMVFRGSIRHCDVAVKRLTEVSTLECFSGIGICNMYHKHSEVLRCLEHLCPPS